MRGKYIISVFLFLVFGFGLAFWRTTDNFSVRVQAATHLAAATKERASALDEKLGQETKARETAEQAWKKVANRAADLAQQLIEQIGATRKLEAKLADVETKLQLANKEIANQIAARKEVQAELYNANVQVRTLSATLQHESGNKEAAEAARMKVEPEATASTEKASLDIKARQAASIIPPAERRASPRIHHKNPVRRQTQSTALLRVKKQTWSPFPPVR
jgi:chromosome segregation ATPase